MTDPKDTLGYHQNNPLNMRPMVTQLWHGQSGSANGFCVFDDPRWCFRAWFIQAHSYRAEWNCKVALDYTRHYAPIGDGNDPLAYALGVEQYMGLAPKGIPGPLNIPFDLDVRALDFCKGQMVMEIGGIPYDDDEIREGFAWAANR